MDNDFFKTTLDPAEFTIWPEGAGRIEPSDSQAYHQTTSEINTARAMVAFHIDIGDLLIQPLE